MSVLRRDYTAADHRRYFAEFLRAIAGAGGATPHLTMVAATAHRWSDEKAAWLGFMYAATYNYAAAEALALTLDPTKLPTDLPGWLAERWAWIPLRRERKAVRAPVRLAVCVQGFAVALGAGEWAQLRTHGEAWDWALSQDYVGRYIAIRLVEFMRRRFAADLTMPDLRAKGAQYPRQALALLYPEHEAILLGDDRPGTVAAVEAVATVELDRLHALPGDELGWVDYYALQALLCEYKQSAIGLRQYPGRSLDSELAYRDKVYAPGSPFSGIASRSAFQDSRGGFGRCYRGELSGWAGPRAELGLVLNDHGYTWDDAQFDYPATLATGQWARPVRRS